MNEVTVKMSILPFQTSLNGYTYTFGSFSNYPNWCAMEVEKDGKLVYVNHIEDIRYGDNLIISPNDEFPEVPKTKLYFY